MIARISPIPTIVLTVLSLLIALAAVFMFYAFVVVERMSLATTYPKPTAIQSAVRDTNDVATLKKICVSLAEFVDTDMQSTNKAMESAKDIARKGIWFALAASAICIFTLVWTNKVVKRLRRFECAEDNSDGTLEAEG